MFNPNRGSFAIWIDRGCNLDRPVVVLISALKCNQISKKWRESRIEKRTGRRKEKEKKEINREKEKKKLPLMGVELSIDGEIVNFVYENKPFSFAAINLVS